MEDADDDLNVYAVEKLAGVADALNDANTFLNKVVDGGSKC